MAFLLEVTFQDVNQLESKSSMWVETEEIVPDVLAALKLASNAKILKASLSTPVPLLTVINNEALSENVETATCKMIVAMRGADSGSSGEPFAHVHVGIPAPHGDLIDGLSGDPSNSAVQDLLNNVISKTGVQMDVVESIKYKR